MAIRKISEFVEASSPQNSDKLLIERNGSGKSITVGNLLNDVVTRTRVNLLRPTLKTITQYGITCTNNGDGTYTINGTATDNVVFTLAYVDRMSGYKLTGCPTNNSGSYLAILRGSIVAWENLVIDRGNGAEMSLDTDNNPVIIAVEQGLTVNNAVFKPMITNDLSATYDDFVSYNDSFIMGINSGIGLDLLWENADIYSAFPEQTVTLDTTGYKFFIAIFHGWAGQTNWVVSRLLQHGSNHVEHVRESSSRRFITVNDSSILFGNCARYQKYGDTTTTIENKNLVPVKIYGVR